MAAINRASIAKQLVPGLNAIFGMEYGEVVDELTPLFETESSDRAFEEEVLFTGFGGAPVKNEGAAVVYDDAAESYTAPFCAGRCNPRPLLRRSWQAVPAQGVATGQQLPPISV